MIWRSNGWGDPMCFWVQRVAWTIVFLCSSVLEACPSCAGQKQGYIELIYLPLAGLFLTPCLIAGVVIWIVVRWHRNKD